MTLDDAIAWTGEQADMLYDATRDRDRPQLKQEADDWSQVCAYLRELKHIRKHGTGWVER